MLWSTPCNLCSSPADHNLNHHLNETHSLTLVPLKISLQNNKTKYEISFDYDIKIDTEKSVAEELRKALNLSEKYNKRIAKEIKQILREKIVMIEILLFMNKQNRKLRNRVYKRISTGKRTGIKSSLCLIKESALANSMHLVYMNKLQIICDKNDKSYWNSATKLLDYSQSRLNWLDKEDFNSRRFKLNDTANERYQATEINSNLFNIYGHHNSFTASSHFLHSFHTSLDKLGCSKDHFSRYLDFPSILIEKGKQDLYLLSQC